MGPAGAARVALDADPLHAIGDLAHTRPAMAAATGRLEPASSGGSATGTSLRVSSKRPRQGVASGGKRRMRNYRAMREEKLRACHESLRARAGDAYDRCLSAGSGDPDADLAEVERLTRERGLC